jgi:hypothetical protein
MFKSIRELDSVIPDPINKKYYTYEVIDDDFIEVFLSPNVNNGDSEGEEGFIELYQSKHLNVPKNLILLFIFIGKEYEWTIKEQMDWNLKFNKLYPQYHKEVEKYLSLI